MWRLSERLLWVLVIMVVVIPINTSLLCTGGRFETSHVGGGERGGGRRKGEEVRAVEERCICIGI